MHQVFMLSLCEGKSFTQRCQDSSTGAIRVSTAARIPVGDLFAPPLLISIPIGGGGGGSEKGLGVNFSYPSNEEDLIVATSHDF
jgi:hypothetical protein